MARTLKHRTLILIALAFGWVWYFSDERSSRADPNNAVIQAGSERESDSSDDSEKVTPTLVGRGVCRECHEENFQLHSRHGHASTFHSVKGSRLADQFTGKQFDAGNEYGTYHYSTDSEGNLFASLPSRFDDSPFPLQYILGSGGHAQTMLTLVPGPDGETVGVEHRVTCYQNGRLGLTPAHSKKHPRNSLEYFGDSFEGEPLQRCVYCHTTQSTVVGEKVEDLVANVNCEKCHGPGSEHVRLARVNKKPPPFSVGQDSWDAESELQLCGDCHRLPRNISETEIRDYSKFLVRFQPVGLVRSRCYLDSNRELKCSDCHNPHRPIEEMKGTEHVQNCLACHQQKNQQHVACPVDPEKGCVDCHMPAVELDEGLQFHDHWIRVHDD